MSYLIKVFIIITIIIAVIFIKHMILNKKQINRIITVGMLLSFVLIIIPIPLSVSGFINGIIYCAITSLLISTDKIFNYMNKKFKFGTNQ